MMTNLKNKYRLNIIVFLSALLPFNCNSQKTSIDSNALLWEITGNGLETPSYLLGTYHSVHYDFLDSIPAFQGMIIKVNQIIVERTDVEIFNNIDNKTALKELMPKNVYYKDILKENEIKILDSILMKNLSLSSSDMKIHPDLLSVIILKNQYKNYVHKVEESITSIHNKKLLYDCPIKQSMDFGLMKQARTRGYKLTSLASVTKEQKKSDKTIMPNELSLRDAAILLMYNITTNDICTKKMLEIRISYLQQDLGLLIKHFDEILNLDEEVDTNNPFKSKIDSINNRYPNYKPLIILEEKGNNRNLQWVEYLKSEIYHTPSLIAVGVAHLSGEGGVISLLRKKGFSVNSIEKK